MMGMQERLKDPARECHLNSSKIRHHTKTIVTMHTPPVSCPGALAFERQLSGLLACQDCHYQLQLSIEFH